MIGERPSSGADAGAAEAGELARARAGDVAAFGALVRRHQERVFRFLHRMLDAREEAMELSQDVFVKAWQALPGWRPEAAFSTWLLQIARNAASVCHLAPWSSWRTAAWVSWRWLSAATAGVIESRPARN